MKELKDNDIKLIEQLFGLTQDGLRKAMHTYLKTKYKEVIATEAYIVAKGNIPIGLVAHMDTVFKSLPSDIYYDRKKGCLWAQEGLGADDRAGVFAIIKIIQAGFRPHIILTTDEERGAVGASVLSKLACPFDHLKFLIELDRRGTNDCVFYDCDNEKFTEYISSFGFSEAWGSFSDICELCPEWGCAGVNLSVGYKDEHTTSELLFVTPLFDTIEKVKNILNDAGNAEAYEYIPAPNYYNAYYNAWGAYGLHTYNFDKKLVCSHCNHQRYEEEMFPVIDTNNKLIHLCPDCIVDEAVDWCCSCGKARVLTQQEIKDFHQKEYYCPECLSHIKGGK